MELFASSFLGMQSMQKISFLIVLVHILVHMEVIEFGLFFSFFQCKVE